MNQQMPNQPQQQQPQYQQQQPNLPPPGYQRQETLKQNHDNLQQQAEVRSNKDERYAVDPNKIRPIREIQHNMSALNITNKQPGYEYCWVNFKSPMDTPGLAIQQKQAEQVYNHDTGYYEPVWEVVTGNMPEAAERKTVDSTRKLGDVLLMRAKKENYDALLRHRDKKRGRLLESDSAALQDLGEKAKRMGAGVIVHPDLSQSIRAGEMAARGMTPAQGIPHVVPSMDTINRQIKNGGLPGAEVETWAGK